MNGRARVPTHLQLFFMASLGLPVSCQGGWELDESLKAAAKRETVEESGVRGKVEVSIAVICPYSCFICPYLCFGNT